MRITSRLAPFAVCCLSLASPAFAQLDSPALRAKLGLPLNCETFRIPPGFDLVVDYGADNQACKLTVPALMPRINETGVYRTSEAKQQMDDFLADLVPSSTRGKELNRVVIGMAAFSSTVVLYERVTVSKLSSGDWFHDTITVRFKNDNCKEP